jgi:hypothetical protein
MQFDDHRIGTAMGQMLISIEPGRMRADLVTAGCSAETDRDDIHIIQPEPAPEVIRETGLSGRTRGRIDRFMIFGCPDGAVSLSAAMAGVIAARSASRMQGAG